MFEFLTIADVARRVHDLSASGVRKAADDGRLEVAARTASGMRLFRPEAVETFRAQRAARKPRACGEE